MNVKSEQDLVQLDQAQKTKLDSNNMTQDQLRERLKQCQKAGLHTAANKIKQEIKDAV